MAGSSGGTPGLSCAPQPQPRRAPQGRDWPLRGPRGPGLASGLLDGRGNGAQRKDGMSRGDSQAVHAVGSRHDEVPGDERPAAEMAAAQLQRHHKGPRMWLGRAAAHDL